MAVPSSGTLDLSKIANEKHHDNYNTDASLPTPPYSLKDISTSGNSNGSGVSYDSTNSNSTNKPNSTAPYSMSEFYGYDHDQAPPRYLEVKTYDLDSFTTGRGTSDSQLSGVSHSLSAINKFQHSWIKVKMLDDTYDQLRFSYNKSDRFEVWIGASDDTLAPTLPQKSGWNFHGEAEGTGTYYVNGSAGQVVYIHRYYEAKSPQQFNFGSMYCQPRQ